MARLVGVVLLSAALLGAGPQEARAAGSAEQGAAMCERAVLTGARRGGVPPEALHAIALTETGRNVGGAMRPWPWAINREGQGHWFTTRDEALAFAKASVAAGRTSFDVGCFQINYRWHGQAFPSLEAMFDQDINGTYAAQFLRSLHEELGTWSAAAGAYHSRTPEFANRYRARFDRIYAGLGGTPLVVAAVEPEAAAADPVVARPSRTRMAVKPKIINLAAAPSAESATDVRVASIRVERGRTPRSAQAAREAARPVAISARNAPL